MRPPIKFSISLNAKYIFAIIFLVTCFFDLFSQGNWTQLANLPSGQGRTRSVSFIVGNVMYVTTGQKNGVSQNDVWAYNMNTNTWQQKNPTGFQPRILATSFVLNGKGYVGCGNLTNGWTGIPVLANDFYEYDAAQDNWNLKASVGSTGRYGAVGFVVGSKGYIAFGGKSGQNPCSARIGVSDRTIYMFDPAQGSQGTWTKKSTPSLPHGVILAQSFVIGGRAYVIGGFTPGFEIGSQYTHIEGASYRGNWEYNPTTDSWTQRALIPEWKQRHGAAAFTILDRALLFGGNLSILSGVPGSCQVVTSCFADADGIKYNPHNDTWTTVSATSLGYIVGMTSGVNCDYGYLNTGEGKPFGGGNLSLNMKNYKYDPALDGQYISGPDLVCGSFDAIFDLELNGSGQPEWTTSSNIYITSGEYSKTVHVRSNGSGPGWVKVSFDTGCRTIQFPQWNVWAGTYSSGNYPVSGPSFACPNETVFYNTVTLTGATNYQWFWPSGWTYLSGQGTTHISLRSGTLSGVVGVRVDNQCGIAGSPATKFTQINSCGGLMAATVYPNPASDKINIKLAFDSTSNDQVEKYVEMTLFDERSNVAFRGSTTQSSYVIDTGRLPRGKYYLNMNHTNGLIQRQIVLE